MTQARPCLICFPSSQLVLPEVWKYGVLALSILLLFVALIILTCQLCECQKLNKSLKKRKYAWNGITEENGFRDKRLQSVPLGMGQQPCYSLKIKKIQKELTKVGLCLPPTLAVCSNDVGHLDSDMDVPERSQGKLKFTLLYNRKHLELLLTITGALGLPSQGCTNMFIQIRLLSCASSQSPTLQHIVHEWQTQVVKNCSSPSFGDQFVCTLKENELAKSSIKLEVKRFNRYSQHIPLGEVRVALNALKSFQSMEFCEELQKATKDTIGEVLVSLKCLPISQRIEVGLLKVKTASLYNNPEQRIYARIDVLGNLHKQRHQKSKLKTFASVTVFNETFLFHLSEPIRWNCTVLISIYEIHPSGRQLFGQAVLGKTGGANRIDNHWDHMMMQSNQQPVAKWYPLLI